MAKRKTARKRGRRRGSSVNKSEEIRNAFKKIGYNSAPKDIISSLASRRIQVSPALVSNVRAAMTRRGTAPVRIGKSRRGRPPSVQSDTTVSISDLLEAKRLVEKTGGIEQAKRTLDALALLG